MSHIVIDARIINSTTGRYVERLLYHLQAIDHENTYTVLLREKDQDYWQPTAKNFSVVIADYSNYSFNEQIGFLRLLNSLHADLVHFCMPEQPILYRGKKVTTIHDLTLLKTYNPDKNWLIYKSKQFIGKFVFRHVARTSKFVLSPTDYTKHEIMSRWRVNDEQVKRIYLAAEATTDEMTPYELPSHQFIMFVGQQSRYKNTRTLQQAHAKLLEKYPDLLLVLVGKLDKPGQENKAYFESTGAKNIIYTGFAPDGQLNWLYKHTAAYIFPSFMEGFGLPGLEAMIQGAPVISSNATCLPEVYGDAAYYFNPSSTDELVKAIDTVISDKTLREQLTKKGYEQAKKYSWRRTAEETLEAYKEALSK